jgi:hypothetical protein
MASSDSTGKGRPKPDRGDIGNSKYGSNSSAYLRARLARDYPEILADCNRLTMLLWGGGSAVSG